jgi:Helix-loop-helix DNA-binding domain
MGEQYPTRDGLSELNFLSIDGDSGEVTRNTGLSSGWQFSAGPVMPEWPQTSTESNFTLDAFGATSSDSTVMRNTWDFSDDALWNASLWEDWDFDPDDIMAPNSEIQSSVSPSNNSFSAGIYHAPEDTKNYESQKELVASRETPSNVEDASNRSSNIAGKRRSSSPSRGSGRPRGRRSNFLMSTSTQAANSISENVSFSRAQAARNGDGQGTEPELSTFSRHAAPLKPPDKVATTAAMSSRPTNQSAPSTRGNENRYHKDTERQYRMRLHERFSELLKALPEEVVESASGYSGRSQGDKGLTKIEILALAKAYIAALEKAQSELEEESLVLRGQQELFKRLFGGMRANNLANII